MDDLSDNSIPDSTDSTPAPDDSAVNAPNGGNGAINPPEDSGQDNPAPGQDAPQENSEPVVQDNSGQEPVQNPAPETISQSAPVSVPPQNYFIKNLLAKAGQKIQFNKNKKMDEIVALAQQKTKISQKNICDDLRFSKRTASRYLDILVKQGRIKQSGKTGRDVFYQL